MIHQAEVFFQKQQVHNFSVVSGRQTGWRCRAKLAVRQEKQKIVIGLFQEGSHIIAPLYNCPQHHPRINEAVTKLHSFFVREGLLGYDEKTHKGDVRYIQCVVERRTGRVQVTIVLNTPYNDAWESKLKKLYNSDIFLWHSLWINVQQEPTNTIFGAKEWYHVIGQRYVWESICGNEVPFLPSHFGQANLEMFEGLLHDMISIFPEQSHVVELFSGIGVISCVLRHVCRSVIAYEIEPSAKQSFLELKKRLPIDLQQHFDCVIGDAHMAHDVCKSASTILVDPTRKGLSKEILNTIVQENIAYVVYVSCCWKTFERDATILLNGGYSIPWARGYLFFPGTDHLETLCLFTRPLLQ